MKRLRIFAVASLILAVGMVGIVVFTKTPQKPSYVEEMIRHSIILKEGLPAYTAAEAHSIAKEVIPSIEKVTGKIFKRVPTIKISRVRDIPAIINRNIPQKIERENAEADFVVEHPEMVKVGTLGIYGKKDKALYLFPRNILPLLKVCGIKEEYTQAIVTLEGKWGQV